MTNRVSRKKILEWLDTIGLSITRIEDIGMGVVFCKILKKLDNNFPNFKIDVQNEIDYFHNLSIVKNYFIAKQIKLYFPIESLCKLNFKANLEVIQWFYIYWLKNNNLQDKNTLLTLENFNKKQVMVLFSSDNLKNNKILHCKTSNKNQNDSKINENISSINSIDHHSNTSLIKNISNIDIYPNIITNSIENMSNISLIKNNSDNEKLYLLTKIEKMKNVLNILQNERNFYYNKLLSIENILTKNKYLNNHSVKMIFDIMYKSDNESHI